MRRWAKLVVPVAIGAVVGVVAGDVLFPKTDMRLKPSDRGRVDVVELAYVRMLKQLEATNSVEAVLADATPGEKMLFELGFTDDEIANGGTYQMLYNLEPSLVAGAEQAARKIGAVEYADLLADAQERFPGDEIPTDDKQRHAALGNFHFPNAADRELEPLDKRWHEEMFTAQMRRYIEQHPSDFFTST